MTLPSSGPLSLLDIQNEFGGSGSISISDYYRNGTYVPDTSSTSTIPTSGEISLYDFYGTKLYTAVLTADISTAGITSSTLSIGQPHASRYLLIVNTSSSSGSLGDDGIPPKIDGTSATMAYSLATTFASDGQRVKLSYIKWPNNTSASFTLIDPAPNRGGRFVVFALYGVDTLTVSSTGYGNGALVIAAGGADSINLLGGAGNSATGLVGGDYTLLSTSAVNMGGILLNASSSSTYTGGQLVAGVKFSVS